MYFNWNNKKNELLKKERKISFEEAVWSIEHKNKEKYKNQKIFIIKMRDYVWQVPFIENDDEIFLKTIIPSRKATKKYLNQGETND